MVVIVILLFDMEIFYIGERVNREYENWFVGFIFYGYQVQVVVFKNFVL